LRIAEWLKTGHGLHAPPTDREIFDAMHTSACQARHVLREEPFAISKALDWQQRWHLLRQYITGKHLGLAYWMTKRFHSRVVDEDDLLSDAMYGLLAAVDHYDPSKGFKFSTYACNVIMRNLLRREKREVRYQRLCPVRYESAPDSYDMPSRSDMGLRVERLGRALAKNLADLTAVEARVLADRFPMDDEPQNTLEAIGDRLGIVKERVRQIQNEALAKLRTVLAEDALLQ
jgi:RNA polymerase primary sigma factor